MDGFDPTQLIKTTSNQLAHVGRPGQAAVRVDSKVAGVDTERCPPPSGRQLLFCEVCPTVMEVGSAEMLILVLVLVLKDSLRTFFKSLSLSWSLGVRSLSLSWSL